MNLAAFSVRRWQFTVVVFGMLAALGGSSLLSIPKAEDPTFPYPNFAIAVVYPGAVPTDLEKLVVDPIEAKLKALDDVKTLKSEMSDGLAVLSIEFIAGTDPDRKYDDVLRELNALRPTLPADLQSIEVKKFNASNVNILQVALVSDTAPSLTLQELADRLKKRLDTVPGTKDATRWASAAQEVRVSLDLERLAAVGLTPLQVLGAIQATNVNIPAGSVDVGQRKFNVKTSGDYASIAQVEDTVVAARGEALVRLRDVAQVDLRDSEATHLGRFDGRRAVFVTVAQRDGQNIFQVREGLQTQLEAFRKRAPRLGSPGGRLRSGAQRRPPAGRLPPGLRSGHRAGAPHPAPARLARGGGGDDLHPALAGHRRGRAAPHGLQHQPAQHRGLRHRPRAPGGRLDRGGGEHHPLPPRGALANRGRRGGHPADRGVGARAAPPP